MTHRGRVKNGVVVLEPPGILPDGTSVSVRALKKPSSGGKGGRRKSAWFQRYERIIGKAKGLPADFAINHDHYLYGTPKNK